MLPRFFVKCTRQLIVVFTQAPILRRSTRRLGQVNFRQQKSLLFIYLSSTILGRIIRIGEMDSLSGLISQEICHDSVDTSLRECRAILDSMISPKEIFKGGRLIWRETPEYMVSAIIIIGSMRSRSWMHRLSACLRIRK